MGRETNNLELEDATAFQVRLLPGKSSGTCALLSLVKLPAHPSNTTTLTQACAAIQELRRFASHDAAHQLVTCSSGKAAVQEHLSLWACQVSRRQRRGASCCPGPSSDQAAKPRRACTEAVLLNCLQAGRKRQHLHGGSVRLAVTQDHPGRAFQPSKPDGVVCGREVRQRLGKHVAILPAQHSAKRQRRRRLGPVPHAGECVVCGDRQGLQHVSHKQHCGRAEIHHPWWTLAAAPHTASSRKHAV